MCICFMFGEVCYFLFWILDESESAYVHFIRMFLSVCLLCQSVSLTVHVFSLFTDMDVCVCVCVRVCVCVMCVCVVEEEDSDADHAVVKKHERDPPVVRVLWRLFCTGIHMRSHSHSCLHAVCNTSSCS